MENLGSYNPDNSDLIVNNRTGQGFAEGTMIETERTTPEEFRVKTGGKGDFLFEKNLDRSGLFRVTLLQNSPDNVYYQTLLDSAAVFEVQVINRQQYKEEASTLFAMVGLAPRVTTAQESTNKVWEFVCGVLNENNKAI